MIIMCPCRLINCNKYNTLVEDADYAGRCACRGGEIHEKSVPSAQICCEPESAPKVSFKKVVLETDKSKTD